MPRPEPSTYVVVICQPVLECQIVPRLTRPECPLQPLRYGFHLLRSTQSFPPKCILALHIASVGSAKHERWSQAFEVDGFKCGDEEEKITVVGCESLRADLSMQEHRWVRRRSYHQVDLAVQGFAEPRAADKRGIVFLAPSLDEALASGEGDSRLTAATCCSGLTLALSLL